MAPGDAFLFGPETRGLPAELLAQFSPECRIRLPMLADSRSLNLSNAVAVFSRLGAVYSVLKETDEKLCGNLGDCFGTE